MIGNVTKVTYVFCIEKLDDIPCIIIFFNARPNCINCCIISPLKSQEKVFIM